MAEQKTLEATDTYEMEPEDKEELIDRIKYVTERLDLIDAWSAENKAD